MREDDGVRVEDWVREEDEGGGRLGDGGGWVKGEDGVRGRMG